VLAAETVWAGSKPAAPAGSRATRTTPAACAHTTVALPEASIATWGVVPISAAVVRAIGAPKA
jgi:hypothetical protein